MLHLAHPADFAVHVSAHAADPGAHTSAHAADPGAHTSAHLTDLGAHISAHISAHARAHLGAPTGAHVNSAPASEVGAVTQQAAGTSTHQVAGTVAHQAARPASTDEWSGAISIDGWTTLLLGLAVVLVLVAAAVATSWRAVTRMRKESDDDTVQHADPSPQGHRPQADRALRRRGAGLTDVARIGLAATRYDLWLELRGVGRRRRRDLREELRANLNDASARVGSRQAVASLGSLRRMAADAAGQQPAGARWTSGAVAASWAFAVAVVLQFVAVISWAGGAEASGAGRVEGSVPLFPGSRALLEQSAQEFSIAVEPGWTVPAVVLLTFLVAARPWLLLAPAQRPSKR